jgi:hypothetical protein
MMLIMMQMQLMQMMQLLQMMMGQAQQGGSPYGAVGNPADLLSQQLGQSGIPGLTGIPGMPFQGIPMPPFVPNFGALTPPGNYQFPQFGSQQVDPTAKIPNFGPNPSKQQIGQMLDAASKKYGVPPEIAKAVAYQETGWANIPGDGGHGKGIMQIDDRSHAFANTDQAWNPAANIDYGVRLLKQNYENSGGNWHDAIRKYNGSGPMAENYAKSVTALTQSQPWQRWG